nr:replicase [Grapevine virus F]
MSISVSSQRVAAASLYTNGDKTIIDQIKVIKSERLKTIETEVDGLFDYYVSDFMRDFISKLGIHTSVHSFVAHPHPVSKMFENYILYKCISSYIGNSNLFISCKEAKIKRFKFGRNGLEAKNTRYNRLIHSKDHFRYEWCTRNKNLEYIPEVREGTKTCDTVVIHDEVQYWSLADLQNFLGNVEDHTNVLYSVVYPVEITTGINFSLFPEAYEFEVHDGYFIWYPDGKAEGAYKQPINPWLLTTSKTEDVRYRTWTITKLQTVGAHHLFSCTPGSTITEDSYTYDQFTLINPYNCFAGRVHGRQTVRLRARMIKPVLLYLMALRKPDCGSAVAKIRMLSHDEESCEEAVFVAELAKLISDLSLYNSMGAFNAWEAVKKVFHRAMGPWWTYLVNRRLFNEDSMYEFIANCDSAVITVPRIYRGRVEVRTTLSAPLHHHWHEDDEIFSQLYLSELARKDRCPEAYSIPVQELVGARVAVPLTCIQRSHELIREQMVVQEVELNVLHVVTTFVKFLVVSKKCVIRISAFRYMETKLLTEYASVEESLANGWMSDERAMEILFGVVEVPVPCAQATEAQTEKTDPTVGPAIHGKINEDARRKAESFLSQVKYPDKLKGRVCAFYSKYSTGYTYTGGSHISQGMPESLVELRRALGLGEEYDHCLVQRYEKGSSIPFHADDEKCYLPGASVLTLNMHGTAEFMLRENGKDEVHTVTLNDGDVLTMPEGVQERFKHSVRVLDEGRVSLTFRNKTVDYTNSDAVSDYEEDTPDVDDGLKSIRANKANLCTLQCIADHIKLDVPILVARLNASNPEYISELSKGGPTLPTFINLCAKMDIPLQISGAHGGLQTRGNFKKLCVFMGDDHVEAVEETVGRNHPYEAFSLHPNAGRGTFYPNREYAEKLSESMFEGHTGILLNKFKRGKSIIREVRKEIKFVSFFGFAGSGKSYYPQTVLQHTFGIRALVISPRKALAADWSSKIGSRAKVVTFEKAVVEEEVFDCIVVDELGLYPPGYLDLICMLHEPSTLVLLGDPLQGTYYNKDDRIKLATVSNNVFSRLGGSLPYLMYSHRLSKSNRTFDIETHGNLDSAGTQRIRKLDTKLPTIYAARTTKENAEGTAYTVSETQGLSFKDVQVLVDKDWALKEDGDVIVAFTRARGTTRYMCSDNDMDMLKLRAKSEVLRSILRTGKVGKDIILNSLRKEMPNAEPVFTEARLANTEEYEEKLMGDPYLKGMLRLLQEEECEEEEYEEPKAPEPVKTHLFLSEGVNEMAPFIFVSPQGSRVKLGDRFNREQRTSAGLTAQIDEMGFAGQNENPCTHKALYLHHKMDDAATFMLSVKKRLRFRDPEKNRAKYEKHKGIGKQMFDVLKKTYHWTSIDSLSPLDKAEADFMKKRLNKSAALLERHNIRSDPDWPSNIIKIFLKQQVCTKLEKRGVDAKAGQTIACFSHAVLCKFGPIMRQTERKLRELLPPNVMVYSQKNYSDLDIWAKTYVDTMVGTDSDYEAFDRSQDEKILDLEVEVLKFFLWPEELIREYVELKLQMSCSMGNLAIMRFSGEFGTFFFNTMCNMVFTCMRYYVTDKTRLCFAGDDMYAPGVLEIRNDYEHILNELSLKAKVQVGDRPLFCGWRMSPYGIVKEPNLVLDRWKIAQGNGSLHDCMVNYAIEASYGYRLSEYLYDMNIDIDAQQELTRQIVLVKHKLPPKVASIFSDDANESWSDGDDDFLIRLSEPHLRVGMF